MSEITIRVAGVEDGDLLRDLSLQTFSESYEHLNTPENFRKYIQDNFNPEKINSELRNSDSTIFIALNGSEAGGYLKLNEAPAQTEKIEGDSLEIERIYVLKKFYDKGMGKILLQKAITEGRARSKKFLWLGVWEKNERAIRFYERNGFKKFGSHVFLLGQDEQLDFLYKLDI